MTKIAPTARRSRDVSSGAVVHNDLSNHRISWRNPKGQGQRHTGDFGVRVGQRSRSDEGDSSARGRSRDGSGWLGYRGRKILGFERLYVGRAPSGGLIVSQCGVESVHPVKAIVAGDHVAQTRQGFVSERAKLIDPRIHISQASGCELRHQLGDARPYRS